MNRRLCLSVIVLAIFICATGLSLAASSTRTTGSATITPVYYGYPIIGGYNDGPNIIAFNDRMDMALIWDPRNHRLRWMAIVPPRPGGLTRPPRIIYGPGRPVTVPQVQPSVGARTVVGEVVGVSPSAENPRIVVRSAGKTGTYFVTRDTIILRGRVGANAWEVPLGCVRPGDKVTLRLGQDGIATSMRAQYRLVTGRVQSVTGSNILLSTGDTLVVTPRARIILPDNRTGSAADIVVGSNVAARLSPITGRVYTVQILPAPTTSRTAYTQDPQSGATQGDNPVSLNSYGPFSTGDTVTVSFTGMAGGKATFSVPGVQNGIPMAETQPGTYQGKYVVQPGDTAIRQMVTVTFVEPNGATYTRASLSPVTIQTVAGALPRITTPHEGDSIASPVTVQGVAQPNSTVRVTVEFRRDVQGVFPVEGVTAIEDVKADGDGLWSTPPLSAASPLTDTDYDLPFDVGIFTGLFNTFPKEPPVIYTITATTLGPNGTELASYSVDVLKRRGRVVAGSTSPTVEPNIRPLGVLAMR